ncbi:phage holin family protein [Synechocystis sp. PCC 7509]|uniref:phage holin family protein n=1 Tax=Synechocystis sp. PCC 7509 TaxID=927677 RepID=UPI0002AC0E50|nr:phage holin family protein [Synechocystis sp. PCC 7509]
MTASDLNQLLEQDLASYNLVVQATQQDECLNVVLNRPAKEHIDYSAIANIIIDRIKTLSLGEIHSLVLSSRVLGEYDTDWQTQFEFVSPSPVEQNIDTETEDSENKNASVTNEPNIEEVKPISTPEVEKSPFANYCFISNKGLLTFQVLPPDETVCKLIQFFHNVPDSSKADILPLLEIFFASSVVSSTEQFEDEIQQWFEQLTQLDNAQIRKASIWFSRYCFNPEKTMTEVMVIIEPEPVKVAPPQNTTSGEHITNLSPTRVTQKHPSQTNTSKKQKIVSTAKFHPLALPIAWLIFTFIVISLTISSFDPEQALKAACKNTTGKQEYCRLAVQMVGETTFKQAAKIFTFPMNSILQKESIELCLNKANSNAGRSRRQGTNIEVLPLSTYGEEIFPGMFFADISQTDFKPPGQPVRTGCLLVNTGRDAEILGQSIIPTNWPKQPFENEKLTPDKFRRTTTVYSVALILGAGTLFNAIGLYIVSLFGIGIRVTALETIYKAAFLLGILESITLVIPFILMLILGLPIKSLALGVIGIFIKDFKVQWSEGYLIVAAGTLIIIGVSFFFQMAMFSIIVSFIN